MFNNGTAATSHHCPFAVEYFDVRNNSVINTEIYESVSTDDIRKNDIYLNQLRNNKHIASTSTKTLTINYKTMFEQSNITNYFPGANAIIIYTLGGYAFHDERDYLNTVVLFFIGRPGSRLVKLYYPENCPVTYTFDDENRIITVQCNETTLVMGYIVI